MKQNTKKILAFSVLALFVFVFAMQFVAATNETAVLNPIRDWFAKWEGGKDFSANIAKYLFWALVSMMVYSIAGSIPGIGTMKTGLKAAFSIIVGFLSMAYITPDEVYAMMNGYGALGFVLGGALPFIILAFFTMSLATGTSKKEAGARFSTRILAMIMWIAFSLFTFTKALYAPEGSVLLSWVIFGISAIMVISIKPIFHMLQKDMREEKKQRFKEKIELQSLKREAEAGDVEKQ